MSSSMGHAPGLTTSSPWRGAGGGNQLHCQGRQDNPGTPVLIGVDGNDGNDVVIDGEVDGHATLTGIEMENWVHKMETSSLLVSD